MSKKSFILNDETKVNSYGFRVPNDKIKLDRFKENAVLLYMHRRGEVHGRWENIRIEGTKLLADPVFDLDDPESKKIAGKVERGFLKGASIYLHFTKETTFHEGADGNLELHNSEAFEGSIVDIPSNADCVKLFADDKEMDSKEIRGIMLSAMPQDEKPERPPIKTYDKQDKSKTTKMEKFKLSAQAVAVLVGVGLSASAETENEVNNLIEQLGTKLTAEMTAHQLEKTAREGLQNQINAEKAVALTALVDQAVTDGKISATQKETFVALGFDGAKSIIDGLPGKTSLGSQVNNPGGAALGAEPKNVDEFAAMPLEQQLAFKNNNPTGYAKLFA
ncbi:peptidase U35 phage prohead HK97 [Pseudopedobacter saltans DSM 12145]|uniref:Peptidase U35 phage prohead HK97 n=1 Tax=Pseudopedobacter saltans (strain ATCC 51119 / DSM 12145 / JCM 21818 / CCUG 39354 / LMG 10337 / NBRC 100064 / NCIMB 13643) TaxID=762903 RepID=F0SAE3_PSESL|nr:peptidase U35 [Pseudopedobacter saltans]ADY51520.1 peptidase U35 phage prohead HK97 [Pseudopedobacter saltans DSM 12145]